MNELRRRREAAGLTQSELATASGVAQSNIAAYESGARRLSANMLQRLTASMRRPSHVVAAHRDRIREIVEAHHAKSPRVFGSVARSTDRPGSDLDLLVTMADDASLFDLAALHLELEELLGVPVDVIDERGLKPKHRAILEDAVVL